MYSNTLKAIAATLDTVEVRGRHNLDAMLGCMQALGGVIAKMERDKVDGAMETADAVREGAE